MEEKGGKKTLRTKLEESYMICALLMDLRQVAWARC
jgi:hypothetical protein